jgi:hypothetical protein
MQRFAGLVQRFVNLVRKFASSMHTSYGRWEQISPGFFLVILGAFCGFIYSVFENNNMLVALPAMALLVYDDRKRSTVLTPAPGG